MDVEAVASEQMCFLCVRCWHQKCNSLRNRGFVMIPINDSQGEYNVMDAIYWFARRACC